MMGYQTVGNTLAEWDDATPFSFSLKEEVGPPEARRLAIIRVNLIELRQGFTDDFLLHLRELLITWRSRVTLITIDKYSQKLLSLFSSVIALELYEEKIVSVDESFLLVLHSVKDQIAETKLACLRNAFNTMPYSPIWELGLNASDFPISTQKKGNHGRQIDRILAKALTRVACVHILSKCEQAYDLGEMDISLFAFTNLAFAVFCRPESYRQIRLEDLVFDKKTNAYFLYIMPAKPGVHQPRKIRYLINEAVGIVLQKQRQHVVDLYSHWVKPEDVGKLALFPAKKLNGERSAWVHAHANENFGMYQNSQQFSVGYTREIQRLHLDLGLKIGANALRHTVGTQLALTGASARTIQGVLKHATDKICKAYVDIAFGGLIDVLSDSMQPAFDKHLPAYERFRSKNDPVDAEQAIRSDDLKTGKIELTGECGKNIQCEQAPITCYGCKRFVPCWDADHGVNLATVQREIDDGKRRGKPFEQSVARWTTAKYNIVLVMNAADRYRQRSEPEICS